tara:strand:+ start:498 stop:788 length:291 start_codon:yes stop_codon:yes gene_type:complete
MMSKTKTELNKMTKKNLLLHIEKMQLLIENDHLKTQESNREMQKVLARHKEGTPENKLDKARRNAGILRSNVYKMKLSSDDRARVIKEIDLFMDKL